MQMQNYFIVFFYFIYSLNRGIKIARFPHA